MNSIKSSLEQQQPARKRITPRTLSSRRAPDAVAWRFRKEELALIFPGLEIVNVGRATAMRYRWVANVLYGRITPALAEGTSFDEGLMEKVVELWSRFRVLNRQNECKSHRLYLDDFEVQLCALCVRLGRHRARHDGPESANQRKVASKLMAKLDRLRKRARRAWRRTRSTDLYRSYHSRCKKFLKWLRVTFGCLCRQTWPASITKWRRLAVDIGVQQAKLGLQEAGIQAPDDKKLRYFVRLAYWSSRRWRPVGLTVLAVFKKNPVARHSLTWFIRERLRKAGELIILES